MSVSDVASIVDIGRHTYGEKFVLSPSAGIGNSRVKIGSFCSFASGIRFMLGGEHHTDWASTFPFHESWGSEKEAAWGRGDIEIGNDVWIGTDVLMLSGSKIGDGAVIGARTVVSGTVAPYSVVAGNPMRFVRWRFDRGYIDELLRIKWWDWTDERIKKAVPYLLSPDIERFIYLSNRGEL